MCIRDRQKHLKNVGPIRHCEPLHCHSPGVATVARRLRIDVHNDDDDDDDNENAWQRGLLWPHRMGPINSYSTTHPFNGPFSSTTWVSWYQKDRTILNINGARDNGVAVASAGPYENHLHFAPDNHTSTTPLNIFTRQMFFLLSNRQHQSTERNKQ